MTSLGDTFLREFSIVVPVSAKDLRLLPKTLPSWISLGSNDIIICTDNPAPKELVNTIMEIVKNDHAEDRVRILHVEKNPDYKFHQAWVRRSGFRAAKHDIILTGDIDLVVYPICQKAVELVGKDGVGLVSLSKIRYRQGFMGQLRYLVERQSKYYAKLLKGKAPAYFTGLYALYRPYWLDSENEESLKHMINPYYAPLIVDSWGGYKGEDTHLRDWMVKKYKVTYLPDIGAEEFQGGLEERKDLQIKIGAKFAVEGRTPVAVLRHSVASMRPYVFRSYFNNISEVYGKLGATGYVIKSMLQFSVYVAVRVTLRLILGKQRRDTMLPDTFKHGFELERTDNMSLEKILKLCRHEFPVSIIAKKIKGDLFVDIGANRGYYSLLLRKNFKKIISFEPNKHVCEELMANIQSFKASNIEVINKAVSNSDGITNLLITKYDKYHGFVTGEQFVLDPTSVTGVESVLAEKAKVEQVSLSSYFKDVERIDLIKVDAEGGEWSVLESAEAIADKVQRWIIELHMIERMDDLESWFKERGYNTRWIAFTSDKTVHIYAWRQD